MKLNPDFQHQNLALRRFDIDWIRVLAFLLLIFYHISMFYVDGWGWHVKSQYQSEFLQNLMLLVNRWRMPLIFLVSGIAMSLVEPRINAMKLLRLRFVRLFLPLLIGMYFIVPPQTYFELVQNDGFSGDYWQFYQMYINPQTLLYPSYHHSPLGWVTWNHLWYLAYLWHYTLLYLLLRPVLTRVNWSWLNRKLGATALFCLSTGLLMGINFWLRTDHPITHDLVNDWYNHASSLMFFYLGYLLVKCNDGWAQLVRHRRQFLLGGLIGYACTLILHNGRLDTFLIARQVDVDALASHIETWLVIYFVISANVICWLFAILGYAARYLNQPNPVLNYLNQAVLPWYILHQTVIIIVAMWLAQYSLGPVLEPGLVILFTLLVCGLSYELLRRNNFTRFLFGMKRLASMPLKPLVASRSRL